jgi:hypothetical protein
MAIQDEAVKEKFRFVVEREIDRLISELARYESESGLSWKDIRDELNALGYYELSEMWENDCLEREEEDARG